MQPPPSSILIVKTSALGDIVHTFPVIDYLHTHFPQAKIDWVVESPFAELVKSHPYVHQVFPVQTKVWRRALFKRSTHQDIARWRAEICQTHYDAAFDLQGNLKSGLLLKFIHAHVKVGFGWRSVPEWPNLLFTHQRFELRKGQNIREDYLSLVKSYFNDPLPFSHQGVLLHLSDSQKRQLETVLQSFEALSSPRVLICPGAFWKNKQLPYESLKEFLDHLHCRYHFQFGFIWGNREEEMLAHALHEDFPQAGLIIPKLSLPALQHLMDHADLVIAMDSLPLHLAGTTDTPTFGFFGPSFGDKYQPLGLKQGKFQGACPYERHFEKRCPVLRTCKTGACLRSIPSRQLIEAFDLWWQKPQIR